MSEIYGWITPKGEFEETERWSHRDSPSIQDLWDELGYQAELDSIEDSCQSAADDGEHPAWHCWEMAKDSYKWEAIEEAYKRGFVRVGTIGIDMNFEYGSGCLTNEGAMKKCRYDICKRFAESRGCAAQFENVHG